MQQKTAKVIRYIMVAPVMACAALVATFLIRRELIGSAGMLVCSIFFLTALPLLAYPLQPLIPRYRDRAREGQRSLAMLFAVGGYVLGYLFCLAADAPTGLQMIYLDYLLSGMVIFVFNQVLHLKASGHACGVAGPAALLTYFGLPALIPGAILLALAWWASLIMKRHTVWQLLGGSLIPVGVLAVLWLAFGTV